MTYDQHIIDAAINILERNFREPEAAFTCTDHSTHYLKLKLANRENETFCALFLNNQNQLIADEELFHGSINTVEVHPRVLLKRAMEHNAAAVILAHNHPSGLAEPSDADIRITKKIAQVLELVDVRLLDHIVVGHNDFISLATRGLC